MASKKMPEFIKGQIKKVSLDEIILWKDNPRKNDASVEKLAELLKVHGQRSPIVVWEKNRTIYKGNTTYKAAKYLGWEFIDAVFTDFPSEQAAIAYGISDNKSSEWSEWDDDILSKLMQSDSVFNDSGFKTDLDPAIKVEMSVDRLNSLDILSEVLKYMPNLDSTSFPVKNNHIHIRKENMLLSLFVGDFSECLIDINILTKYKDISLAKIDYNNCIDAKDNIHVENGNNIDPMVFDSIGNMTCTIDFNATTGVLNRIYLVNGLSFGTNGRIGTFKKIKYNTNIVLDINSASIIHTLFHEISSVKISEDSERITFVGKLFKFSCHNYFTDEKSVPSFEKVIAKDPSTEYSFNKICNLYDTVKYFMHCIDLKNNASVDLKFDGIYSRNTTSDNFFIPFLFGIDYTVSVDIEKLLTVSKDMLEISFNGTTGMIVLRNNNYYRILMPIKIKAIDFEIHFQTIPIPELFYQDHNPRTMPIYLSIGPTLLDPFENQIKSLVSIWDQIPN